jgi:transcriptional regulator
MHPDAAFRTDDRMLMEALVDEIGFGMIFAATPDGPRVAHTPLVWANGRASDGVLHFHLSRGNALTRHLDGATVLALVNGPEGYVSPRWYADGAQVPTWNYVALELEGRVSRMDAPGLRDFLDALIAREEARVAGGGDWSLAQVPEAKLRPMLSGIVGFSLEVQAWRPTLKLSQNKSAEERERVAGGLEAQGSRALAELMRRLAA